MGERIVVDRKVFDFWTHIAPAADVPGVWVAHCLDFDIVTQGASPADALKMIREAVTMCLIDDLEATGCVERERAPEEFYKKLDRIFDEGVKVSTLEPPKSAPEIVYEYAVFSEIVLAKLEPVAVTRPQLTIAHQMAA